MPECPADVRHGGVSQVQGRSTTRAKRGRHKPTLGQTAGPQDAFKLVAERDIGPGPNLLMRCKSRSKIAEPHRCSHVTHSSMLCARGPALLALMLQQPNEAPLLRVAEPRREN